MKYKLKKDLKVGDLIDVDLGKDVCEEVKEHKRWRAEEGETYFLVDGFGDLDNDTEDRMYWDDFRWSTGNYFKTKQEARRYRDYLLAYQELRDLAEGFVPDWEDQDQLKYHIYYRGDENEYRLTFQSSANYSGISVVQFETREKIENAIKVLGKEKLDLIRNYPN